MIDYKAERERIRNSLSSSPKMARELDRLRMDNGDITLTQYNYDTNEREEVGTVSMYTLRRSINEKQLAALLEGYLNGGRMDAGWHVGLMLRFTHRTLQRLAIKFCLDLLRGISKQVDGDPRNQDALDTAKEITRQYEAGELNIGMYI